MLDRPASNLRSSALAALIVAALLALPAIASAGNLEPRGNKIFFGTSDTGDSADFGGFSRALDKHPALIQSFRSWGTDFDESIQRWQKARARPILHIATSDKHDGHELISPRQIANGVGDRYLLRLNKLFWAKKMRAYLRPISEPNRCLNVWAAFDCEGKLRDAAHKPRWYRQAFRRMYILLHGGARTRKIDRRLAEIGLPPVTENVRGIPRAPIAVLWSVLPAGSPTVPHNRPKYFYPGDRWVDWVGTDFYSDNQDWKSLRGLYNRFSSKPFALPEWGVSEGDDPGYVEKTVAWCKNHERCKMLVYYQDFGSVNRYRIQNYPASLGVLDRMIHSKRFPHFAPGHPTPPPAPPGGVGKK
jgi:hypothetical protein